MKINQILFVLLTVSSFACSCEKTENCHKLNDDEHFERFIASQLGREVRSGKIFFAKAIAREMEVQKEKKQRIDSTFEWHKIEPTATALDEKTLKHYEDISKELVNNNGAPRGIGGMDFHDIMYDQDLMYGTVKINQFGAIKLALKTSFGLMSAAFGGFAAWDIMRNAYAAYKTDQGIFYANKARLKRNIPLILCNSMASAYLMKDFYQLTQFAKKI